MNNFNLPNAYEESEVTPGTIKDFYSKFKDIDETLYFLGYEFDHVVPLNVDGIIAYHEKYLRCHKKNPLPLYQITPKIIAARATESSLAAAKKVGFALDHEIDAETIAIFKEQRRRTFDERWALCGLDIETYMDTENEYSATGNFKPYLLSIYGKLQRLEKRGIQNNGTGMY